VASITRLTVLEESFERPEDFDLREEWSSAVARFEKGLLFGMARLRVTQQGMARLHRLGAAAVEQAERGALSADGWQEVTLPVEQIDYAAEQLLGLAAYVEVLEPPELRERLRQLARRIARLNAA